MEQDNTMNLSPSMEAASAALAARCYGDPDFARQLREDPKAAIEEACGKKLPESLAIEVHENDGRTWHVPVPPGGDTDKLSDDQLKDVSGGFEIVVAVLIATSIGVGAAVVGGATAGAVVSRRNRD